MRFAFISMGKNVIRIMPPCIFVFLSRIPLMKPLMYAKGQLNIWKIKETDFKSKNTYHEFVSQRPTSGGQPAAVDAPIKGKLVKGKSPNSAGKRIKTEHSEVKHESAAPKRARCQQGS